MNETRLILPQELIRFGFVLIAIVMILLVVVAWIFRYDRRY